MGPYGSKEKLSSLYAVKRKQTAQYKNKLTNNYSNSKTSKTCQLKNGTRNHKAVQNPLIAQLHTFIDQYTEQIE